MLQWRRVSGSFLESSSLFRSLHNDRIFLKVRRVSLGVSQCRRNHHGLVAGTVLARGDTSVSSKDLIDAIKPEKTAFDKGGLSLTILVSAQYARLALDDSVPGALLGRLFGKDQDLSQFESVTAVVDQLPQISSENSDSGLSFLVQRVQSGSLLDGKTTLRASAQRAGSLTFAIDVQGKNHVHNWETQMPLAQTVFSTGLTSTMIHRVQQNGNETASETQLENLKLKINSVEAAPNLRPRFPLIPLTTSHEIGNAMGNIIRTVLSNHLIEQPASQGLEKAVHSYFKALQVPPAPVNVWALVVPKSQLADQGTSESWRSLLRLDEHVLEQIWTSKDKGQQSMQQYGQALIELIPKGGRLVKVLSGGGGWGKKAGLLSIDPDFEYSTRELRDDQGWNFNFDDGAAGDMSSSVMSQLDQALGNCVDQGDGIMFFIDPEGHDSKQRNHISKERRTTITVGARKPTEIDGIATTGGDVTDKRAHVEYIPGHFGMFSETGLAVKVFSNGKLLSKSKLEVPDLQLMAEL